MTETSMAIEGKAKPGLSERTTSAIRASLAGAGVRFRPLLFAGPAVVVSIAYIDPGNFATNIQGGARYGYALLWVVVLANVIAMLFQGLSAKLGIVTGRNLAELCRQYYPRWLVLILWVAGEGAAMATDLAEFLGGAIGLSLLLHCSLLTGMGMTAAISYGLLLLQRGGFRPMEIAIGLFVITIGLCYLVELLLVPIDWRAAALGSLAPQLPDGEALTLCVAIIGATLMPHAVFLHSSLTQDRAPARNESERRKLLRYSNIEVVAALGLAGLVNMAMMITAAAAFHRDHAEIADIASAYLTLTPLLGAAAGGVFLLALLASGLSSSTVGTMSGQMVMQGFLGAGIPLWLRRAVTMIPAFVVVGMGVDSTKALILSQVVLSFALPAPLIPLILFTRDPTVMGRYVNGRWTDAAAIGAGIVVLALNGVLALQTLGVAIPGLA